MIFEGPSGRMGTPDNPEEFICWQTDDITIHISRQLLREKVKPGAVEMLFYIDGYGRHTLAFDPPYDGKV